MLKMFSFTSLSNFYKIKLTERCTRTQIITDNKLPTKKNEFYFSYRKISRIKVVNEKKNGMFSFICNSTENNFINDKSYKVETINKNSFFNSRRIPVIAIVGKGNVGKSTLFNRLTNSFENGSIVHDTLGITRDKLYKKAIWCDYEYLITDTGGFVINKYQKDMFSEEVKKQALVAIQEANLVIFLVDGQSELDSEDIELARFLKFQKTPVILAVNKCENFNNYDSDINKFWSLGFGEPIPISAIHGTNTGELLDKIIKYIPKISLSYIDDIPSVAIIGRPNVGKSSILNFLHGKKKSIVSDVPGTTRDSLDSYISGGNNFNVYNLIDTAGIRKKKSVEYGPEFFMINRSFKSIEKSDCVLVVIDASVGITEQDQKLAEMVNKQGKACVILFNKWDKISLENKSNYEDTKELIRFYLPSICWASVLFISAKDGTRCDKILNTVDLALEQYNRHIPTSIVNEIIEEAIKWRAPPVVKNGKQAKIYYSTQINDRPPTFAIFVNEPILINESYKRYIENQLRNSLGFQGTSIKIF
nr:GTP-binding protein EngA [Cryptomonas curvata]